jgi:glutamine synthetase
VNLFSTGEDGYSDLFLAHIAGLQKYLPHCMPLLAPNVNSYRRLRRFSTAPINVHWGTENRTVGLRVPASSADSRRIENRIAGADANPYLAIAASLACGYLGMTHRLEPTKAISGSAYRLSHSLPTQLGEGLEKLAASKAMREVLGEEFVEVMLAVKETEHAAYQSVISSWEREHLLLNV